MLVFHVLLFTSYYVVTKLRFPSVARSQSLNYTHACPSTRPNDYFTVNKSHPACYAFLKNNVYLGLFQPSNYLVSTNYLLHCLNKLLLSCKPHLEDLNAVFFNDVLQSGALAGQNMEPTGCNETETICDNVNIS